MTATLAPPIVSPDDFRAFKQGDERALKRIFSDMYAPLVEEATRLLTGDGTAASRAVENAFVQAWRARHEIEDEQSLEAGLRATVRDEAVRMLSRVEAARRLDQMKGGHTPRFPVRSEPGVDEAWQGVYDLLHIDPKQVATDVQRANVKALHQATEQLGEMEAPAINWKKAAVILVVLALVGGAIIYLLRATDAEILARSLNAPGVQVSTTAAGELSTVRLPDGSVVRLGPQSSVLVAANFGATIRGTEVIGTADFTVRPVEESRFIVRVGSALVTATGTAFVVRRYPEEQSAIVFVRAGEVIVAAGDSSRRIAAGEAVEVTDMESFVTPARATVDEMVGWRDSTLAFSNRTLGEMLVEMERWFGVKLAVGDSHLLDRPVTMRIPLGDYDAAMTALQQAAGVRKTWKGEVLTLVAR